MATITTRAGKGAPLSWTEMDTNLTNLNSYKVEQDISGNATITGDVYLTGSGKRITGDFSNATVANRVMFQTSTENSSTVVSAIPSGTGTQANFNLHNKSDPANASDLRLLVNASEARIQTNITGAATYLPMTFHTGGSERMQIDTSGNVRVTSPAGLGYGTGAGGTVTQATSKSTAVTLNKPCGHILMATESLASGSTASFVVNNSLMNQSDCVFVNTLTYGSYQAWAESAVGSFRVYLKNVTGVSIAEAVVINFAIIKGATA